jgi:Cu+-exporting ATPase
MAAAASNAPADAPGCLAPASLELEIEGMTCNACVHSLQSALARLPPGLRSSRVTLGHASVRFAQHLVSAAQIAEGASAAALPRRGAC